jgi:hypothetical protein
MANTLASKDVAATPVPPPATPVVRAQPGLILASPSAPLPYGTPIVDVYDVKPGFAHPKPGLTPGNPRSIGTR